MSTDAIMLEVLEEEITKSSPIPHALAQALLDHPLSVEERSLLGMLLVSHILTCKTRHSANVARSILTKLPRKAA